MRDRRLFPVNAGPAFSQQDTFSNDPGTGMNPNAQLAAARLLRNSGQIDGDQFQQMWNQGAADVWTNRVNEMRGADDQRKQMAKDFWGSLADGNGADPSAGMLHNLGRRYGGNRPSSLSRFGDELYVNGQPAVRSLTAEAQSLGITPDEVFQNYEQKARAAAARRFTDTVSGNVQATFAGSRMTQDPEFQSLYRTNPQVADALYQQNYGQTIAEAMMGDQLGGNLSVAEVRRRRSMPELQKAVLERVRGVEAAFGYDPAALVSPQYDGFDLDENDNRVSAKFGYDPETGFVKIPGRTKTTNTGETVRVPSTQVYLGPEMYQRLQDDMAMLAGYSGQSELMRQRAARQAAAKAAADAERAEWEQMRQRRQAAMNPGSSSAPRPLTGTLGQAMSAFAQPPPAYPKPAHVPTDADVWASIQAESALRNPLPAVAQRTY